MRIAAIGRTEILYDTVELLIDQGHEIPLIVTAKEAPEYTKTSDDLKQLAHKIGAKFIHTAQIETILDDLKNMPTIDIAVSINYSGIIPQSIIDSFPFGVLNAHGGDLPRYRGNACQAWAILNGEDKIGLCIHSMVGGELDNGDIIARDYISIDHNTKITAVWNWMKEQTPHLFSNAVNQLNNDSKYVLEKQSTNPKNSLRCYPRKPEDAQINWSNSNINILRLINASNKPYTGAFCNFEGSKLTIWDAELNNDSEVYIAVPGQITNIGVNYIDVATGNGKIRLKKIEHDSKIMPPNTLVKSIRQRLS